MYKEIIANKIRSDGILPLYYHYDQTIAVNILKTLYYSGIRVIEFTNRGINAVEVFTYLKDTQKKIFPDLFLGIGTVKTNTEAEQFIEAGADFIVSPIVNSEIAEVAQKNHILWIPGCMTPTEIHYANSLNATLVKIFPAYTIGASFISAVREVLPETYFIATGIGSLDRNNVSQWFDAGVSAIGLGSKLISQEIMDTQSYEKLSENIKNVLSMIKSLNCKIPLN